MISRNFIKASAIYTLAGALPMASAFFLLPFYLGYLSNELYGALSLYLAFSFLIQVLVTYSFDTSLFIYNQEYNSDPVKLKSFLSSVFTFMLMIACALGFIMILAGELLTDAIFQTFGHTRVGEKIAFYPFGMLAFATGIFQAIFRVYTCLLQSQERAMMFLKWNLFLFSTIAFLTLGGLYAFPDTLAGPIGGRALAGLAAVSIILFQVYRTYGLTFNYRLVASTFGFNNYSFIYQLQQWLINYADRFVMLFAGMPLGSIGVYDFAIKCLVGVEVISASITSSFYPRVVAVVSGQSVKATSPETNGYYYGLISIVMVAITGSILLLPFALEWLSFSNGYDEVGLYFPLIAGIFILKAIRIYFAYPYAMLKYTRPLPVIYTFVTLVKIVLMIFLIRDYGVYGLVYASGVSLALELLVLKRGLKGKFVFAFDYIKILIAPLSLLIAILILEPMLGNAYPTLLHLGYLVAAVGFLLVIYRKEVNLASYT